MPQIAEHQIEEEEEGTTNDIVVTLFIRQRLFGHNVITSSSRWTGNQNRLPGHLAVATAEKSCRKFAKLIFVCGQAPR